MRHQRRYCKLAHEALEPRVMMAADTVTVLLSDGNLRLTGDAGDNGVALTVAAGTLTIAPDNAHTVLADPGGIGMVGGTISVDVSKITALAVDLLAGNDSLRIDGLNLTGALNVTTGDGANTVDLKNMTVAQATIQGGQQADTIGLSSVAVNGQLTMNAGNGVNIVNLLAKSSAQGAVINCGKGVDTLNVNQFSAKNLNINMGQGNDVVTMTDIGAKAGVQAGVTQLVVNLGPGDDVISFFAPAETGIGNKLGKRALIHGSSGSNTINGASTLSPVPLRTGTWTVNP